jgi:hypothetical protein
MWSSPSGLRGALFRELPDHLHRRVMANCLTNRCGSPGQSPAEIMDFTLICLKTNLRPPVLAA